MSSVSTPEPGKRKVANLILISDQPVAKKSKADRGVNVLVDRVPQECVSEDSSVSDLGKNFKTLL